MARLLAIKHPHDSACQASYYASVALNIHIVDPFFEKLLGVCIISCLNLESPYYEILVYLHFYSSVWSINYIRITASMSEKSARVKIFLTEISLYSLVPFVRLPTKQRNNLQLAALSRERLVRLLS